MSKLPNRAIKKKRKRSEKDSREYRLAKRAAKQGKHDRQRGFSD